MTTLRPVDHNTKQQLNQHGVFLMSQAKPGLLSANPKVDQAVVAAAEELEKRLPRPEPQKKGADYNIAPPFGGVSLTLSIKGR